LDSTFEDNCLYILKYSRHIPRTNNLVSDQNMMFVKFNT
jgi:hypothetical protein